MSHIKLNKLGNGIVALFVNFPEVGEAMSFLAETILRPKNDNGLPVWYREFIASCVSGWNRTEFCGRSHMAAACAAQGFTKQQMYGMMEDDIKLKSLYVLARKVTGNEFTGAIIDHILEQKIATNEEIHDVVAIAAAFSMYNRYVVGLGVERPQLSKEEYSNIGKMLIEEGYLAEKHELVD